jgi:hypothetical protein
MVRGSPADAAEISRRGEPNGGLMLLAVIVLSLASLIAVAAMLDNPGHRPRWQHNLLGAREYRREVNLD